VPCRPHPGRVLQPDPPLGSGDSLAGFGDPFRGRLVYAFETRGRLRRHPGYCQRPLRGRTLGMHGHFLAFDSDGLLLFRRAGIPILIGMADDRPTRRNSRHRSVPRTSTVCVRKVEELYFPLIVLRNCNPSAHEFELAVDLLERPEFLSRGRKVHSIH